MSNSARNYAQELLDKCKSDFSAEYSQIFQYKSIKRFLPPLDLTPQSEEFLKARLFSEAKIQEKLAFDSIEELNKTTHIEGIINEIFEIRMKNEILAEIGYENDAEKEAKWFELKMLAHFNELLRKELEEYQ